MVFESWCGGDGMNRVLAMILAVVLLRWDEIVKSLVGPKVLILTRNLSPAVQV